MSFLSGRTSLTTVQTGDIADNAVTLAKMAGGTDGNLIGIDANGDPAYIATGSDGQVLTSGGANVAALMEDAGGGAWNHLATHTVSGAGYAEFTSNIDSTYAEYVIIGVGIFPGSDVEDLWCRVGNGGSYDAGTGYDYVTVGKQSDGTGGVDNHDDSGDGVGQIVVNGDFGTGSSWGTASGETGNIVCHLHDPSSSLYTRMDFVDSHDNATGVNTLHYTTGTRVEAAAHDRIQFLFSSGTITGTFRLYGIANS
jgi:hypothetical protein